MDSRESQQLSFLDALGVISSVLQIADYQLNVQQISNDTLFEELQKQNKLYLKKIIEQQKEILKILSKLKEDTRQ